MTSRRSGRRLANRLTLVKTVQVSIRWARSGGGCAGIAVAVWLSRPRRSAGASVDASEGN
jgi:hypothetical protein